MAHPEAPHAVKVGVLLARRPDDVGEWLATGAAFDAAGADALWVDVAPEPELDPLALTAALAAVTVRSLLVTTLEPQGRSQSPSDGPPEALARVLATIWRLSGGRLAVLAGASPPSGLDGMMGRGLGVFRRVPGNAGVFEHTRGPDEAESWASTALPDSRATWRATVLDAAERGTRGLLVPADPRLLDLLRNPDDSGHRRDLHLAVG